LAAAACGLAPAVGEAWAAIAARPGCLLARMSGSGGTCFGIFETSAAADGAAAALAAARPGWWVVATTMGAAGSPAV
jgi:4-diphosphocytidyl-2-C-methyl-D-erythritol kinase